MVRLLFLIVITAIILSAIAVCTYLVGSEEKKRWIAYGVFSIISLSIFLFFKQFELHRQILHYELWKQSFLVVSFHSVVVTTIMAVIALPKSSLAKIKDNLFPILSISTICLMLVILY